MQTLSASSCPQYISFRKRCTAQIPLCPYTLMPLQKKACVKRGHENMRAYATINVRWQLTYIIQIKRHLKHQTAYRVLKEIYTWMFLKMPSPRLQIVNGALFRSAHITVYTYSCKIGYGYMNSIRVDSASSICSFSNGVIWRVVGL